MTGEKQADPIVGPNDIAVGAYHDGDLFLMFGKPTDIYTLRPLRAIELAAFILERTAKELRRTQEPK